MMLNLSHYGRQILLLLTALLLGSLLVGCGGKDKPKPSAEGYYDGPMKGKGTATKATPPP